MRFFEKPPSNLTQEQRNVTILAIAALVSSLAVSVVVPALRVNRSNNNCRYIQAIEVTEGQPIDDIAIMLSKTVGGSTSHIKEALMDMNIGNVEFNVNGYYVVAESGKLLAPTDCKPILVKPRN